MSFANLINLSKVANLGYSCISSKSDLQITHPLSSSSFIQVEASVTRRSPLSPVREDLPHTVPQNTQALRLCITRQVSPYLAHNIAALLLLQFSEVTVT